MKPTWASLNTLGTSSVVNSSFVWLAVIPFFAKVLSYFKEAYPDVTPSLPFNFVAFYYSAFAFSIAAVIFHLRCPKLLKLAPTYGGFVSGAFSTRELKHWFHDIAESSKFKNSRDPELICQFMDRLRGVKELTDDQWVERRSGQAGDKIMSQFWDARPRTDHDTSFAHEYAVSIAEKRNVLARMSASIFYGLGFVLLACAAAWNLRAVILETAEVLRSG